VTNDDLLFRHRLRLFARAREVGVSRACRELGYHRSSYHRWRPFVERHGLDLRPREHRPPRMRSQRSIVLRVRRAGRELLVLQVLADIR